MAFRDLIWILVGLALTSTCATVMLCLAPFVYDFRFRPGAVDMVLLGGRLMLQGDEEISSAFVGHALNPLTWLSGFPLAIAMPNRLRLHVLVVRSGRWTTFLTPADPQAALAALQRGNRPRL